MKYSLRNMFIAITILGCGFAAFQYEDIYFRFKYGPRVPAQQVKYGPWNDASLGLVICGQRYYTDDSRAISECIFWAEGKPKPDIRLNGVWHTRFADRPFVVKLGREVVFARPNVLAVRGGTGKERNAVLGAVSNESELQTPVVSKGGRNYVPFEMTKNVPNKD